MGWVSQQFIHVHACMAWLPASTHEDGNHGEAWAGSLKLSFAVKHGHQDALGYEAFFLMVPIYI